MARRPAQFGAAQIKKREPVRPLMVLLLIAAGGILLYLWLQKDSVDPLVAVAEDPVVEETAAPAESRAETQAMASLAQEDDLTEWWYDVEGTIYDAFQSLDGAKSGSCSDLEYAVSDLGAAKPRKEQQIRSPFSALVGALDSGLAACRSENAPAVSGAESAAKGQLKSLLRNLEGFGVPRSTTLSEI